MDPLPPAVKTHSHIRISAARRAVDAAPVPLAAVEGML